MSDDTRKQRNERDPAEPDVRLPYEKGEGEADPMEALVDHVQETDREVTLEGYPVEDDAPEAAAEEDDELLDEDSAEALEDDDPESAEEGEEGEDAELHTVRVNGEELEVTLDELKSGYSRTADYTRKTQELAAERRAVEGQADALGVTIDAYRRFGREHLPPEVVEQIEADYAALSERVEAETRAQLAQTIAAEREKLHEAIPEWADPEVGQAQKRGLARYLNDTYGFTAEQLNGVTDHRLMVMAEKARRWDDLQANGQRRLAEKAKKPSRRLKPGGKKPRTPARAKRLRAVTAKVRATGDARDGAAAIKALLGAGLLD